MTHPLHVAVGGLLTQIARTNNGQAVLDKACGGVQQIPLFSDTVKSRGTQLCKVDAMLVQDGKVKAILEIEETGFIPTKVCGKFLTSALAVEYIHGKANISLSSASVVFIQIIDASLFTPAKHLTKLDIWLQFRIPFLRISN